VFRGFAFAGRKSYAATLSRLNRAVSLGPGEHAGNLTAAHSRRRARVLIRMIKRVPAPLMDGFDVRGFHLDRVYDVDHPVGRYLILAGYAEPLDNEAHDGPTRGRPR
jgi:hypothetical protein